MGRVAQNLTEHRNVGNQDAATRKQALHSGIAEAFHLTKKQQCPRPTKMGEGFFVARILKKLGEAPPFYAAQDPKLPAQLASDGRTDTENQVSQAPAIQRPEENQERLAVALGKEELLLNCGI